MKQLLSTLSFIMIIGLISVSAQCCKNPTPTCKGNQQSTQQVKASTEVTAYYFHATRRCATCEAVESVTEKALKEYYGEKVTFISINREKDKDNPLLTKYKVNGQTLLIVKGDKVVNLTTTAFMNARNTPEKLKAEIKSTVDSML